MYVINLTKGLPQSRFCKNMLGMLITGSKEKGKVGEDRQTGKKEGILVGAGLTHGRVNIELQ